ncbi:hypothetical protein Golax_022053, partial [Gossypium laxum]|nr:hypothetical protein [Gossypium laxum]
MWVVTEMVVLDSSLFNNDEIVSLDDDRDNIWVNFQRSKQFLLYHPVVGEPHGNHIYNDVKFTTMSTKVHKVTDPNDTMDNVGLELFDDLCPIELKFNVPIMNFEQVNVILAGLSIEFESILTTISLKRESLPLDLVTEMLMDFESRGGYGFTSRAYDCFSYNNKPQLSYEVERSEMNCPMNVNHYEFTQQFHLVNSLTLGSDSFGHFPPSKMVYRTSQGTTFGEPASIAQYGKNQSLLGSQNTYSGVPQITIMMALQHQIDSMLGKGWYHDLEVINHVTNGLNNLDSS